MDISSSAKTFTDNPPYHYAPYSSRNWGGKWHSLCSYHGKLKPSIAYFLVKEFTNEADVIFDPLCGVGTIPFEACKQGRYGIGNDLSRLAYCVTKAKLELPQRDDTFSELEDLKDYIELHKPAMDLENLPFSDFGFNKTLSDYFERQTLAEIVLARSYFLERFDQLTASQALVMSSILHILHGNRPYALSRRSHPLTPYAPSGEFVYKNLIEHARKKILMTLDDPLPDTFVRGSASSMDCLDVKGISADAIITSPPFAGSMRFYMQNWMRLWFSGWAPDDYVKANDSFFDSKQNRDMSVYRDFFEMCSNNLKENGIVILHLGRNGTHDMAAEMKILSTDFFDVIYSGEEDVRTLEKHGVKDKGSTTKHQFLFLKKA